MPTKKQESFLPSGYEVPTSGGRYYKLQQGENRFRVLSSPIVGNEYWAVRNGQKKPVRLKMGEAADLSDIAPSQNGEPGKLKHFWAMPVYDYRDNSVKVLEITQGSIQKAVKELAADEDWGSPVGYDLVITRKGEGMETEYGVIPKPAKELSPEASEAWQTALDGGFELTALFANGDPFTGILPSGSDVMRDAEPLPEPEEVDISDIEF